MKVKFLFSIAFVFFAMAVFSQETGVAIGKTIPSVTLDVAAIATDGSTAEGFIGPRLTGDQLTAKNDQYGTAQHTALVYVTQAASATTGKTKNVKLPGYYFYDAASDSGAGLWIAFADTDKEQFYTPTILLPTDPQTLPDAVNYTYSAPYYTVNLYNIYKDQLDNPQIKSSTTASLRTATSAADFYYFVPYYDTAVFNNVTISAAGVLRYMTISGYILSEKSFINVIFREK